MTTGSLIIRESVEALLAGQEIEKLLALGGEVALTFGDEGRATNKAGCCFDGIAGLHAEKLTKGFRPERRHACPIELTLAWLRKTSFQGLVPLGIGGEDARPIIRCEQRRHDAGDKLH